MSNAPNFRPVGTPLEVPDADLDQINRRLGVPTLVTASTPPPVAAVAPRATQLRAINIHLPDYVFRAVKDRAHQQDTSIRFIVMKALADSGIEIDPADLIEDARRART